MSAQPGRIDEIGGRAFLVAFPDTTRNITDSRWPNIRYEDRQQLFVYSPVANRIEITGADTTITVELAPGGFTVVELRELSPIVTSHCTVQSNTFRVVAESPVVLYQYLATRYGAEAWTPLPIEGWGTEYFAAAFAGEIGNDVIPKQEFVYGPLRKMFPAEILVIAAHDDTRITIETNGAVIGACATTDIVLDAGEAFQIQSHVDTAAPDGAAQADFAGSRITATKPVGVIAGNTRAQLIDMNIGLAKNTLKNMAIEWLPPVSLYGTEFVYTPTCDARRPTGDPSEKIEEKRVAEFVRVYGADSLLTHGSLLNAGTWAPYDTAIERGAFAQFSHGLNIARVHKTDRPAQAMMNAPGVVYYAGATVGFGGYIGAAYDTWSGYMVEMTPRERWPAFAPFYAPSHPPGLHQHFINVVTDSSHADDVYLKGGERFVFQFAITGSDLVWGTMELTAGADGWLDGRDDARFYAWVYGTMGGHEEYRPGAASRRATATDRASPGDGDDAPLHPLEYEEYLAIAYAYPLASCYPFVRPVPSPREPTHAMSLGASAPHPFGESATIPYSIERPGYVTLVMYDALGRVIARLVDAHLDAGEHAARFDATALPAGAYHVRLSAGGRALTRTLIHR